VTVPQEIAPQRFSLKQLIWVEVRAGMPSDVSSFRMRIRTAAFSTDPAGRGRCPSSNRPSTASARAAENWVAGASKPSAVGREVSKAASSQMPAASTAKELIRHKIRPSSAKA